MRFVLATCLASLILLVGVTTGGQVLAQEATVKACSVESPPPNCKTNMWALRVRVPVQNGAYVHVPDPGCMNETTGEIEKSIKTMIAAGGPKLALFSGPIAKLAAGPVAAALKNQGGDLGKFYSPYAKNGALCAPMVAVVPQAAQVIGFRLQATDAVNGNAMKRCAAGADCPIGYSKFQRVPAELKKAGMRTYTTIFMNWSNDRSRDAEMIIFFQLPAGKKPLLEL